MSTIFEIHSKLKDDILQSKSCFNMVNVLLNYSTTYIRLLNVSISLLSFVYRAYRSRIFPFRLALRVFFTLPTIILTQLAWLNKTFNSCWSRAVVLNIVLIYIEVRLTMWLNNKHELFLFGQNLLYILKHRSLLHILVYLLINTYKII